MDKGIEVMRNLRIVGEEGGIEVRWIVEREGRRYSEIRDCFYYMYNLF